MPVAFSSLHGHAQALAILTNALRSDRVHHAWIFHGPPGVGKFTAALAFAALLLDPTTRETTKKSFSPDADSPTQQLLRAGSHPDLHIIQKELALYHDDPDVRKRKLSVIPVDVVRSFLLEPGARSASVPSGARAGKVFIVDEAELLGPASQNAVLKFLEEPPERTVTILVTSSEEQLLPTIRSRCQRVFFGALSKDEMSGWMASVGLQPGREQLAWLLEYASGSPGALTEAAATGMFAWWERLAPLLAGAGRGDYSVELGPAMASLVEAWAVARVEGAQNASKDAANRAGAERMFRLVGSWLRQRLRDSDPTPALSGLDALRAAEAELDSNVNAQFVFEKLASELAAGATPAR